MTNASDDAAYTRALSDLEAVKASLSPLLPSAGTSGTEKCYINIVMTNGELDMLASALEAMGRLGPNFMYVLSDSPASQFIQAPIRVPGIIRLRENKRALMYSIEGFLGVLPNAGDPDTIPLRKELNRIWAERTVNNPDPSTVYYDNGDKVPSTVSTVYAFDAVLSLANTISNVIKAGGFNVTKPSMRLGLALLGSLKGSSVQGASGIVSYSNFTGGREGASFDVVNLQMSNGNVSRLVPVARTVIGAFGSLEWIDQGRGVRWPSGRMGLSGRPDDVYRLNMVGAFSVTLTAIGLTLLGIVFIAGYGMNLAKLRVVRPPPMIPSGLSWWGHLLSYLSLATEFWQLMSLSIIAGPQDRGLSRTIREWAFSYANLSAPELSPKVIAWSGLGVTTVILLMNIPLCILILDVDFRGLFRNRFPRMIRVVRTWAGGLGFLAFFYFPLATPTFFPVVSALLKPFSCNRVQSLSLPGIVQTWSNMSSNIACGSSEHILLVSLSCIGLLFYALTHATIEAFMQISGPKPFIFSPSSMLNITLIKIATLFVSVLAHSSPGLAAGFHALVMLIAAGVSRTVKNERTSTDIVQPSDPVNALFVTYEHQLTHPMFRQHPQFCSSAIVSRLRRNNYLLSAAAAIIQSALFFSIPSAERGKVSMWNNKTDDEFVNKRVFAGSIVILVVWGLLWIEAAVAGGLGWGPVPVLCALAGMAKDRLLKTGAAKRLLAFQQSFVTVGEGVEMHDVEAKK